MYILISTLSTLISVYLLSQSMFITSKILVHRIIRKGGFDKRRSHCARSSPFSTDTKSRETGRRPSRVGWRVRRRRVNEWSFFLIDNFLFPHLSTAPTDQTTEENRGWNATEDGYHYDGCGLFIYTFEFSWFFGCCLGCRLIHMLGQSHC